MADLGAIRAALGDPEVVLFGHSMGCQVVLERLPGGSVAQYDHPEGGRGIDR